MNTLAQLERCILVGVDLGVTGYDPGLEEFGLLAASCGFTACATLRARRKAPDAATFIGSGKVQELAELVQQLQPAVVLIDQTISPIHQRNLARALSCPVMDRTGLILEIFAQRAKSHEGKLQVELAQLKYQSSRLVRQWSHLERQRGGIGVRGGPGERQLELDKRMLAQQVRTVEARLHRLKTQRGTQRRARMRTGAARVSIVGYTNAGKSTLFNALTHARTLAADQLFATLDTTTRRLYLGPDSQATLSDTVGFVRDLPHMLVAAFKSTLQEAADASLLLHVVDASSPERDQQIAAVNSVLEEIGASEIQQWLIMNKVDRAGLDAGRELRLDDRTGKQVPVFYLSARRGDGLQLLRESLALACARSPAALTGEMQTDDDALDRLPIHSH